MVPEKGSRGRAMRRRAYSRRRHISKALSALGVSSTSQCRKDIRASRITRR